MPQPDLALALEQDDLTATCDAIASVQLPDGSIPWYHGGRMDPWNHVEAAMALDVGGLHQESERAYAWLMRNQRPDGSWHAYYRGGEVIDSTLDSNVTAYLATGVWLNYLVTHDRRFRLRLWPAVQGAMNFVLGLQMPSGAVRWARNVRGRPTRKGLVAGASSVHLSLKSAARIAAALGHDHRGYDAAAMRLALAIRKRPDQFLDKSRWAMDWYYPVLGGALRGAKARRRLETHWTDFVQLGRGVRCVVHRPWVTAAETCELAIALVTLGETVQARQLFDWAQHLRGDDAAYWMGANYKSGDFYPPERPSWSSAAVVLAADALAGGPTVRLFSAH